MSQTRYLKSMITPTKVEPTTGDAHIGGTASGVWSAQDQLEAKRGGAWPDASVANPDTLIENNFSTFLYTGTGASKTITNDINLSSKGGMIWFKNRTLAEDPMIVDTIRGGSADIYPNEANAVDVDGNIASFNSDGFTFTGNGRQNVDTYKYVSWTFKQAPKFFDIVTYTGNGTAGRTIAHSLGSTVGMMLVKNLSRTSDWEVYHRGADDSAPEDKYLRLNENIAVQDSAARWNDTAPTSSVFTVGDDAGTNNNGDSFVAYLFGHETGSDSMIKCDKFTANASGEMSVDLGFEPQFVMIKNRQSADNWLVYDTMRGYTADQDGIRIRWDTNAVEGASPEGGHPNATGFATDGDGPLNAHTYIYMAIRRPNMATITDATKVFNIGTYGANRNNEATDQFFAGFPIDMQFNRNIAGSADTKIVARLTSINQLDTNNTDAQVTDETDNTWDSNTHYGKAAGTNTNTVAWMWKRAKGYFDVVAYTGTGSAKTEAHGLGVAPEMMWVKNRGVADPWAVYYGDNTDYLVLNTDAATVDSANWWNDTSPTSSVFTVGTDHSVNASGEFYISYLFATLAGVSKVGSYTGTGDASAQTIDCGFTSGARFVLIKCTSHSGQWYLFDSTRGITSTKNDGVLYLNATTASQAESSAFGSAIDAIQPDSSGFKVQYSDINADGRSFLFYAIA